MQGSSPTYLAHLPAHYFCFTGCHGAGEGYRWWDFHEESRVLLLTPAFARKDKSHSGQHAMKDKHVHSSLPRALSEMVFAHGKDEQRGLISTKLSSLTAEKEEAAVLHFGFLCF